MPAKKKISFCRTARLLSSQKSKNKKEYFTILFANLVPSRTRLPALRISTAQIICKECWYEAPAFGNVGG